MAKKKEKREESELIDRSSVEHAEQGAEPTEDVPAPTEGAVRGKRTRRRKTALSFFRFLIQLATTTIFVFGLLTAVGYFTLRHFIARPEVQVPNLVGLSLEEALARLKPHDLALILDKKEYSDAVAKGEILGQYPYPGTRTKIGYAVKVIMCEGTPLVEVPNVRGETLVRAGIRLREADLQVGTVARVENAEIARDNVIAQDPPPGSGTPRKHAINLLVSEGETPREFLMPNLTNATLVEAQSIISKLGLSVETIKEIESPGKDKGIILEQQPAAGETIRSDTKIALTVASGLDVLRRP